METAFKDWKIDKSIGEGGFGKVYRIVREDFGHTYEAALKIIEIPQHQSEVDSVRNDGMTEENITEYFYGIVEDIVEEFALMSRLKGNSNIVSYEDHAVIKKEDVFGWTIYIRMELLTPLFSYVKDNTLSVRDIIQLGIDICHALEICQKYNIIHRDIKPENIFVSDVGTYKLGDFGIARELEKTSSGLSKKGTKGYMAPEVYKGLEYNSTVDIYSLGIVLYRFLNDNRLPFMPPAPQPIRYSDKEKADVMRMSGQTMPKPLHAEGRLAEIILKACSYVPSERYESASAMRAALEEILYSETERPLIYPGGDTLENKKADYVIDTSRSISRHEFTQQEIEAAKEGTVYLFNNKSAKESEERKKQEEQRHQEEERRKQEEQKRQEEEHKKQEEQKRQEEEKKKQEEKRRREEEQKKQGEKKRQEVERKRQEEKRGEKEKKSAESAQQFVPKSVKNNTVSSEQAKPEKKKKGLVIIVAVSAIVLTGIAGLALNKDKLVKKEEAAVITEKTEAPGEDVTITETPLPELIKVPDFAKMSLDKAKKTAEENQLLVEVSEEKYSNSLKKGTVISQNPEKNQEVEKGTEVALTISKGIEKVAVPSLRGKTLQKAKQLLKKNKLKWKLRKEYSNYTAKGKIMLQSVKAGKQVEKQTVVTLTVSKGKKTVVSTPAPVYSTPQPVYTQKPAVTKKPKEDVDFDLSTW